MENFIYKGKFRSIWYGEHNLVKILRYIYNKPIVTIDKHDKHNNKPETFFLNTITYLLKISEEIGIMVD